MDSIVLTDSGSVSLDCGVQAFVLVASGAGVAATADIYKESTGAGLVVVSGSKWAKIQAPINDSKILNVNVQVDTIHVDLVNAIEFDIIKK